MIFTLLSSQPEKLQNPGAPEGPMVALSHSLILLVCLVYSLSFCLSSLLSLCVSLTHKHTLSVPLCPYIYIYLPLSLSVYICSLSPLSPSLSVSLLSLSLSALSLSLSLSQVVCFPPRRVGADRPSILR